VIGAHKGGNVQFVSVLVGFAAFAITVPGAMAPGSDTSAPASTHSVNARRQCGGLNHEGSDAVYYNCASHPVKIEIRRYFGVGPTIECVPGLGQYHSNWWNTKDQKRIAGNCG
jgi:hypothetical protein